MIDDYWRPSAEVRCMPLRKSCEELRIMDRKSTVGKLLHFLLLFPLFIFFLPDLVSYLLTVQRWPFFFSLHHFQYLFHNFKIVGLWFMVIGIAQWLKVTAWALQAFTHWRSTLTAVDRFLLLIAIYCPFLLIILFELCFLACQLYSSIILLGLRLIFAMLRAFWNITRLITQYLINVVHKHL